MTAEQLPGTHAPNESASIDSFARDIVEGLTSVPRAIPSVFLYDRRGSELFRRITQLPEYYLTRCEAEILRDKGTALFQPLRGEVTDIIELGAGFGEKTAAVLRQFDRDDVTYRPFDVCRDSLGNLSRAVVREFPGMKVSPVCGDFMSDLGILAGRPGGRLVLFLGSSIGNMTHDEAAVFLNRLRAHLSPGDYFLIGFDLRKDVDLLRRAYDDAAGVTAALNLNLLRRINDSLDGDFDLHEFRHAPRYNPDTHAMESYLVSRIRQRVELRQPGFVTTFDDGESIQTESSHKYTIAQIEGMAEEADFVVCDTPTDSRGWFALSLWRAETVGR